MPLSKETIERSQEDAVISIARCRELFGSRARTLSDQELKDLRHHLIQLAEVVIQAWERHPSQPASNLPGDVAGT